MTSSTSGKSRIPHHTDAARNGAKAAHGDSEESIGGTTDGTTPTLENGLRPTHAVQYAAQGERPDTASGSDTEDGEVDDLDLASFGEPRAASTSDSGDDDPEGEDDPDSAGSEPDSGVVARRSRRLGRKAGGPGKGPRR